MKRADLSNPLVGTPLTTDEDDHYAERADRIEADDYTSLPTGTALVGDEAAHHSRQLLDSIIGSEELDRATGPGRPSLSGSIGDGHSPKRQVRLPESLDARLTARAEAEHRNRSEIMRDALELYLAG